MKLVKIHKSWKSILKTLICKIKCLRKMINYSFYFPQEDEKVDKRFNSFSLKMNGFHPKINNKVTKYDSFQMEQWLNHHY